MAIEVRFRPSWIDAYWFERALSATVSVLRHPDMQARFVFPEGSKLMVDAGIRLLSLVHQLDRVGKSVTLEFEGGRDGTFGYLDRMGFLEQLPTAVAVIPERPRISAVAQYRGRNPTLVEFEPILPEARDRHLPSRLADVLLRSVGEREDATALSTAAFTVLSEMIDNVYEHSQTHLAGYAVQQLYHGGGRAKLAVSDSGLGLLDTLKESLNVLPPRLAELSDTELVVEAFRNGLSRCGGGRGGGLKICADHAVRYRSELRVRLYTSQVHLKPSTDGYSPNMAYTTDNLPPLWGTHISFDFELGG